MMPEEQTRPGCAICGEEQTDVVFMGPLVRTIKPGTTRIFHIGFPVCDVHHWKDLTPDQYSFDSLIVEVV